jgi:hypothetical protein
MLGWMQHKTSDQDVLRRFSLGGHSFPRTHRGTEQFPGMTITYALMEAIELIQETQPSRAKVICKATVTKLLTDSKGAVVGVEYSVKVGSASAFVSRLT